MKKNRMFPFLLFLVFFVISSSAFAQGIVIDHTCTELSQIPPQWLDAAKQLTLHYAHTSHGSQVLDGSLNLESLEPDYAIEVRYGSSMGLPAQTTPPSVRVWSGTVGTTYVTPDLYYDSESGRATTRSIADTGDYDFSMFSFCGQLSSMTPTQVQFYLDTMAQFEIEYPSMRFILMTGHTDGSGVGGTLNQNNEMIRQFAIANNMVCFDFADIESWNPDGEWFLDQGCNDNGDYNGGNWCMEWCAAHPGDPLCDACSCAHSQPIICNLKGRAFWWMMARLAGWSGTTECINDGDVTLDGALTANDAQLAFQITLGMYTPTAEEACAADCNGDEAITAADAQAIFYAVLGAGVCEDPL